MKKNGSYNLIIIILILLIVGVIIFMFMGEDDSYTFTLEKEEIIVSQGTRVVSNYTAVDSKGNNINNEVTIDDKVNVNVPGEYTRCFTINHKGKTETKCQKIIVKEKAESKFQIKLNGEDKVYLLKGKNYNDEGAKVYNETNTEVKIVVNKKGTINNEVPGEYELTYYFDVNGIHKEITRKIVVYDVDIKETLNPSSTTSGTVKINLNITSDYYSSTVMPDGKNNQSNNITYEVNQNGDYKFIIYDKYDNPIEKVIKVNNIKRSYKCNGVIDYKGTTFTVTGDDNSLDYVKSYTFNINGKDYSGNKSYTIFKIANTATLKLKLKDGTDEKVTCSIKDNLLYHFKYDANNQKPYMSCNTYTSSDKVKYEKILADSIKNVGYGTRAGVVEAARFLTGGLDYKVKYLGPKQVDSALGRYNKVGLNIGQRGAWGCMVSGWTQGMDCTNFVEWAFKQNGLSITGGVYGTSNTYRTSDVVNQIRAGDFMLAPNNGQNPNKGNFVHIGIVVGVDSNSIYVAEATTGSIDAIVVTRFDKNTIGSTNFKTTRLYQYPSDGKYSNMWLD